MEVVVGTKPPGGETAPNSQAAVASTTQSLYATPSAALKEVRKDYLYWTGKLTETSLQLSYAILAANWAVFGSVDGILKSRWAEGSVTLVVIGLAVSVVGAKRMGELHGKRIDYAETNPPRWDIEFNETAGKRDPWPFTRQIESLGKRMREAKTWLPVAAGIAFFIGLLVH
jgi:hypothetical protein